MPKGCRKAAERLEKGVLTCSAQRRAAQDMKHAGNILIASLGRQPENTLLHWAGSWACAGP